MVLAKKYRIKKRRDFENVFQNGYSEKGKWMIIKAQKNKLNLSRFGFIVSNKIAKKAVIRNKIRRRLSEAIRLKLKEVKKGFDVIILALPGIEKINYKALEEDLMFLLTKIGILKKENPQ